MKPKVIGKVKLPKKKHYQKPLKVSVGDALRKAYNDRSRSSK